MKAHRHHWLIGAILTVATVATAGTVNDLFDTSHDYLSQGVVGTIWDGVYFGAGEFNNVSIAGVPGRTLKCDANVTAPGRLTVQTTETAWEYGDDDGFFLYKVISGDFQVVVRIVTPYDNIAYNTAGLMARAFAGAGEPLAGGENWIHFTRFDEYGFANYGRSTINNDTARVNPGDPQGADLYWLMLERVGNTFNCYQKAAVADAWSPAWGCSWDRPDLDGMPMQVGIIQAIFSGNSPVVQFENFSLTNEKVGLPPLAAPTGLTVADGGTGALNLSWTPGAGTAGSVVVMHPGTPATRQPSDGTTYVGNAQFGSGDALGGTNFVVYAGTGNSVLVSGLTASVNYHVAVYSYSGSGADIRYNLASPATGNRAVSGALLGVTLTFPTNAVAVDDTLQATVTANYEGGGKVDVTAAATYSSWDPAIATITAGGLLSALAPGSADIIATYQGKSSVVSVTVVKLPVTDDFSVPRDYLAEGLAGTPWHGLLLGVDDMPSGGAIGGNPGQTLVADAGITKPGRFTVKSQATDWELANDDGFLLYRVVAGDFRVSVQHTFFEPIAYNWPGLMARLPFEVAGAENYVAICAFDQYGIGNYVRSVVNNATANGPFTAVPAVPFIMMERMGNTFNFYEKAHALDAWTLVHTLDRDDLAGMALQVGIAQACFSDNTPVSEFANFVLEIGPGLPVPAPPTNLALTRSGLGAIKAQWTPGAGSAGSIVLAHARTGLTRQPVDGAAYTAGDNLGAGNMVVYVGTGNSVTVPNLAAVFHYFAVYSYADVGGATVYNLNSAAGRLEALGVPSITADPVSKSLYVGRTARFSGSAIGTSPLQYRWRKGGVDLSDGGNISGATTPTLTVANLTAADAGAYTLAVSNEAGSVTSNPATLAVVQPGGTPYESAVISYQPVAYWRFGEPAGATNAFDYYGGYDGAYNAGDTLGVPGPTPADGFPAFSADNTAVNLPGTDGTYVATPALNLNSANVTILCWIKPTTSPNNDRAGLYTYTGAHRAGMRFVGTTDKLGSLWYGSVYNSALAIPANVWSMVAMTVSPTELKLYLGNASGGLQSQTFAGAFAPEEFNGTGIIGNDSFVGGRNFNGDIDEVAVFNYTLTPAQMLDVYAGVPQPVRPALSVARSGSDVVISWPESATGFSLKTSAKLGAGASWDPVSVTPVVVGGMNTVTLPASGQAAFFRLQK